MRISDRIGGKGLGFDRVGDGDDKIRLSIKVLVVECGELRVIKVQGLASGVQGRKALRHRFEFREAFDFIGTGDVHRRILGKPLGTRFADHRADVLLSVGHRWKGLGVR